MRIAVANAGICMGRGGSERAAIRLANEMRKAGHYVMLLSAEGASPPLYKLACDMPKHFFPASFHQRDRHALAGGGRLLKKHGIEVLVSFESDWKHEMWQACAASGGAAFVCSERINPGLAESSFWNGPDRRRLLAASAGIHELLPQYLKFIPGDVQGKVFVLPNAAPEGLPWQERRGDAPALLYLGRFFRHKRPMLLLKAFALLASEFPAWTLRVAGWGEEEANLVAARRALKLEKRVEIRPALQNVLEEYAAADIYCLPSFQEGFPNAVVEAMSCGLPVVGIADCMAMSAIIRPGQNGLLSAKATPEELACALRPLMAAAKPRLRMGRQAWLDSRKHYNGSRIFASWETELQAIVDKHASTLIP